MPKYIMQVSQFQTRDWIIEVEADSVENAREVAQYAFDEQEGYFYSDTQGLLDVREIESPHSALEFEDIKVKKESLTLKA